jgi:PilZ domain
MAQARKNERSRAILGATVIFNNRQSTISCQIRNISRSGARLSISEAATLPEEFEIEVPQKGKTYRARLCWRERESAGVEFILESASGDEGALVARVAELEAENAALRLRVLDLREKLDMAIAGAATAKADKAA